MLKYLYCYIIQIETFHVETFHITTFILTYFTSTHFTSAHFTLTNVTITNITLTHLTHSMCMGECVGPKYVKVNKLALVTKTETRFGNNFDCLGGLFDIGSSYS